ncbi:MAG TPA: amidase [Acidimicrobiales bacterium]|nr:amidase [Acidimicrobiales bacterium]
MKPDEYRSLDAVGLAALIAAGEVDPAEVLDAALGAIGAANPELNAVVNLMAEPAHRAVRSGLPAGPFRGVPFLVKDLGANVAGQVTTNGSRLYADGPPAPADSVLVARFRRAGLVLAGKTNTPEFGLSPSTEPALFGPARNPFDPARSPGGSSGGAAAAVASGMVPMAHASDGGGSIRIPASCCGLFGLKPTRGRVTYAPERGEGWAGQSTQHAVSRTVRDSAALLDAVAGPAPGDPYWAPAPTGTFADAAARDPVRLRVGVCVTAPTGTDVDPECRAAAEATARRLEQLGHRVEPVDWPFGPELLAAARAGVIGANVAATVDARLAELGRPLSDGDLEPVTLATIEQGRSTGAVGYVKAVTSIHQVGRLMGGLFQSIDALVTPTLACLPPELGPLDGSDPARFVAALTPMVAFTAVLNMSGQPAVSLPLDRSAGGLPVGSQVIGRYGDEATLFGLAGQLERAHPWVTPG